MPDETADFLNEMGLDLANDDVVRLHAQLEGWIAGMQLVALTLQRGLVGRTSCSLAADIASSPIT